MTGYLPAYIGDKEPFIETNEVIIDCNERVIDFNVIRTEVMGWLAAGFYWRQGIFIEGKGVGVDCD